MATYVVVLDSASLDEPRTSLEFWSDLEVIIEFTVSGGYQRATRTSPAEHPDVEIECYRIPKSLADLLGCKEVLDSAKVEAFLDMDSLYTNLLEFWQDEEPEFDDDDR